MQVKSYFVAVLALSTTLFFTSCGKDEEAPKISVSSPANHSEHHMGDEIAVSATFTDDTDLASYSAMIGDEAGEHTHAFHFEDEGDIEGKEYKYSKTITVPSKDLEMVYYLHFKVKDAEGNEATEKVMLHFHQE